MSPLDPNSSYLLKTGASDGSQTFEKLPVNVGMIGTDNNGNPIDNSADMYKVKVNAADTNPDYLEAKVADTTDVQFKPTDDNDKIDSIVYQLTGLGAMLNPVKDAGFDFENGPFPAKPSSGGRGIAFGRRFVNGVEVDTWVAQGNNGKLYWTNNRDATRWKVVTEDSSLYTAYPSARTYYGWSCIQFVYVAGTHNCYCWVMGSGDVSKTIFFVEHKAENYNTDGTIKTSALNSVTYGEGLGPYSAIDIMQVDTTGGIFIAGDDTRIGYTTDLATFTIAVTADHNIGGMGFDGDNTVRVIERDYGVIWKSTSYGAPGTFAKVTSIFVDDVETSHFPVPNSAQWGSMFCMYGQWLSINFHYVSGGIGFIWSDDGEYWYTSTDEATQFYDANNDGLRWFGTNAVYGSGTPIYQLIVSVIPAHRRMSLEKGAVIDGVTILRSLPDAEVLGTDSRGRVIAKSGGGYVLPIASDTVLGGIKVGANLTIDPDGTLNAEASGVQGPQGYQGADGAQGSQGASGANGAQGNDGAQGVQGAVGAQGSQGPQGASGAQGAQGSQGASGAQGSQGAQGFQGPQGASGDAGSQGVQGATGATGAQGPQGVQGPQGSDGAQGSQGAVGAQGSVGAQGTQGANGAQGAQGTQGTQGTQGYQGDVGAQGSVGAQGVRGSQGSNYVTSSTTSLSTTTGTKTLTVDAGLSFTIGQRVVIAWTSYNYMYGIVTSYSGTTLIVSVDYKVGTATASAWTINLIGDKGAQGDVGAQGAQGVRGYQGYQGYQGTQGLTGVGVQGAQGAQGATGSKGAQGAIGSQGLQGAQGAQGSQGSSVMNVTISTSNPSGSGNEGDIWVVVPA